MMKKRETRIVIKQLLLFKTGLGFQDSTHLHYCGCLKLRIKETDEIYETHVTEQLGKFNTHRIHSVNDG